MLVQQGSQFSPRRSTAKAPWTASEARQTLGHAAQSGMSLAQYSRVHGIPAGKLAWWFERLSQPADSFAGPLARQAPSPLRFVPVVPAPSPATAVADAGPSGVEIAVGQLSLRLARNFCPKTLAKVLDVLAQVQLC